MKSKLIVSLALLLATLSLSKAQSTNVIVQWTFENLAITNYAPNPAPSTDNSLGAEFVQALGMTNYPTTGYGTNDPDVLQGAGKDSSAFGAPGSSAGGDGITNTSEEWRVRATGAGNGWSSQAPVGTQGAQFSVDTTGYGTIQVAFDWYLTSAGEANLQFQYTDNGTNWTNAIITVPAAQSGYLLISNNIALTDPNSVQGYFAHSVTNKGGQEWYTNLTVAINDPLAANNPNFGIRMVNASTGASCISGTGAALNNSSGNWRFDNVTISGVPIPVPVAQWNFENIPISGYVPNPAPSTDHSIGTVSVNTLGMTTYASTQVGTNDPDVLQGAGSDSSPVGTPGNTPGGDGITNVSQIWRVRAQGPNANGWSSLAPPGAQGAQFNADTSGFTNIQVTFDWYLTAQGEANLQLQYSDDGINWSNLAINIPVAQSNVFLNFVNNTSLSDPYSVQGYFVSSVGYPKGQQWYTNLSAVITDPAAANNKNFGIRMVNASTGSSCVSGVGTALNNSSGNWRFDNVTISGLIGGALPAPPVITPSSVATVDGPFTNTFTDNANWRTNVGSIKINGTVLTNTAYAITNGQIVYTPSVSTLLQKSGTLNIAITATNYGADTYVQIIGPGAAASMAISSPAQGPTGNGGTLISQPALTFLDQYGNIATNCSATYTATPSSGWSFGPGSSASVALINGVASFTNLSAVSASAVSSATITLTPSGASGLAGVPFTTTNTSAFNIPGPVSTHFTPGYLVVEQQDVATKNSTFSMLEINPTVANQAAPVLTLPVSATGSNALRQSSSGSCGLLSDSQDGTLLCFIAGLWGDSTLSDVTTISNRGCGTFNYQGAFTLQTTYVGDGGATANQARSAGTLDDVTYYMGDKGGVYTNNDTDADAYILYNANAGVPANVRSIKTFGGIIYAMQQEGGSDPAASVMTIIPPPSTGAASLDPLDGFLPDGTVLDFYMLSSGQNGTNYDTVYYIDGTNTTSGAIFKYYNNYQDFDSGVEQYKWQNSGPQYVTPNGGDGVCAVANPNGGVDLYYTTGSGGSTGNSVVHVYDNSAYNAPINIVSSEVLYTCPAGASLRGIAFAPVAPAGTSYAVGSLTNATYSATGGSGFGAGFTFQFDSTAGVASSFSIWSTTNLLTPFNKWTDLGHPTEGAPGAYTFTDSGAVTNPQTFYQVTSP
jgi:hypothetical protein